MIQLEKSQVESKIFDNLYIQFRCSETQSLFLFLFKTSSIEMEILM